VWEKWKRVIWNDETKFFIARNFLLVILRDSRLVSGISNVFGTDFIEKVKYDKKAKKTLKMNKPKLIEEYNMNMHGVDWADQMIAYYDFSRRTKKWWRKVFFYLFQVSLGNDYQIYKQNMRNQHQQWVSSKDFRAQNIEYLLGRRLLSGLEKWKPNANTDPKKMHLITSKTKQRQCVFIVKMRDPCIDVIHAIKIYASNALTIIMMSN